MELIGQQDYKQFERIVKSSPNILIEYIHWLLIRAPYGAIVLTDTAGTSLAVGRVVDLYSEWIRTGIKPDQSAWLEARKLTNQPNPKTTHNSVNAADIAAYIFDEHHTSVADITNSLVCMSNYICQSACDFFTGTPNLNFDYIKKFHVDKIDEMIGKELFTWEDYENE